MPENKQEERSPLELATDPKASAQRAGLHYVTGEEPGFQRKPWGRGFTYLDPSGAHVTDETMRARLEGLVIPPAWTDVWICEDPAGHIQATGRDDKGRKQYIYHPDWEQVRSETKFNRMILFGEALPEIRARCQHDLRLRKLNRDKVLGTVVTLLDRTLIRIGNPEYARDNGSYGLTTLRDRHVDFVSGARCTFSFKGKSGKKHEIELNDRRLARVVRACRDVPGYELFQYYDDDGRRQPIGSGDVNTYLRETTGQEFSAKDFRTWGGTIHAAAALCDIGPGETEKACQKNVTEMVRVVSDRLGNTTTVCRKYYIHPGLLDAYVEGTFAEAWQRCLQRDPIPGLEKHESALLHFLRDHL